MVGLAAWIFAKALGHYDLSEILRRFQDIPVHRVIIALACVAISYMLQAGYDYLALASLGRGVSLRKSLFAAFIGNAFTNNIGLSFLTGPSIRFRFYHTWGFTPLEVAQVVAMTKLAFLNGLFTLTGLTQILYPIKIPSQWGDFSARPLGFVLLLPGLAFLAWNALGRGSTIRLGKLRMVRPSQAVLLLQLLVSSLHLVFSALTLYFLLPQDGLRAAGFAGPFHFLPVFMAIKVAALFLPIPGSLGILEGAAVLLLTPALPDYPLLGGLLAYRLLYYLAPFATALVMLVAYESISRSGLAARLFRRSRAPA